MLGRWLKRRIEYGRMVSSFNFHWSRQSYLALDMETTGLNPEKDQILSVGWVWILEGNIKLKNARHMLIQGATVNAETIGIHLITDNDLESQGRDPKRVMRILRKALSESILVAHHAPIETGFLKQIWAQLDMPETKIRVLDTMALERNLLSRRHEGIAQNALRLSSCRERYGLPDYQAHDALTDALSVGELLMAQASHLGKKTTLETLYRLAGKEEILTGNNAQN